MDVSVLVGGKIRKIKLPAGATIKDAIEAVDGNEQTVIVKLNGKVCHSKKIISAGDNVELIGIIYGG